jgi:hypothetical protein
LKDQIVLVTENQLGKAWEQIHPAQQALLTREHYVACRNPLAGHSLSSYKVRGAGAIGDTQLGVDVLNVVADGLDADAERGRDLFVRSTPREEAEHVSLPCSQSGRAGTATRSGRIVSGGCEHRFDRVAIEASRTDLDAELVRGIIRRQRVAVRTGLKHGVVCVAGGEQASRRRQHHGADAPVIAGAVHAFVVCGCEQPNAS